MGIEQPWYGIDLSAEVNSQVTHISEAAGEARELMRMVCARHLAQEATIADLEDRLAKAEALAKEFEQILQQYLADDEAAEGNGCGCYTAGARMEIAAEIAGAKQSINT